MASKFQLLWFIIALLYLPAQGTRRRRSSPVDLGFNKNFQDVIAHKKSPLLLNCSASTSGEHEPLNITWLRDGVLVNDARRYVLRNGSLYFRRVVHKKQSRPDEGHYECLASNAIGTIASRKIHLQVASISRFTEEPQSMQVVKGQSVRLHCKIHAVPEPLFIWKHNGDPVPFNHSRYKVLPSGVLQISGVLPSDAGRYRCEAYNVAGKRRSKEAILNVTQGEKPIPLKIIAGPARVTTRIVGESALLECLADGNPLPKIVWFGPGGRQLSGPQYKVDNQGNLEIKNLMLQNAGLYTCNAYGTASQMPASAQGRLEVDTPPKVVYTSGNEIKPAAQNVRLICSFDGIPKPRVTWLKNGKAIHLNSRIKVLGGEQLLIEQLMVSDSGYYQCRGENRAGLAQDMIRLLITRSDKAPDPPTNLRAIVKSSTEIQLLWDPSPDKDMWRTEGYSIHYRQTSGNGEENQMVSKIPTVKVMNRLLPHTNYTFYVKAYNTKGASVHSKLITAMTDEDVPSGAPLVTLYALSSTSIKVTWQELPRKKAHGVITRYRIQYRPHGQSSLQYQHSVEVSGDRQEHIIKGLLPRTKYDVRVMAGTKIGYPCSKQCPAERDLPWKTIETPGQNTSRVPPTPITRVMGLNATAIQVKWKISSREPILGFKLFYNKPGQRHQRKTIILVEEVQMYIIKKLGLQHKNKVCKKKSIEKEKIKKDMSKKPFTTYEVSLLAFNMIGSGKPYSTIVKTMKPGVRQPADGPNNQPPRPPDNVVVTPIDQTRVQLKWQQPEGHNEVVSYTICYAPASTLMNSSSVKYLKSEKLTAEIENLLPFTEYQFSVRSNTDKLDGPFSKVVRCRTAEGKPSAPQNTKADFLPKAHAVELRWDPPAHKNGIIVSYTIFYRYEVKEDTMKDMVKYGEEHWESKQENGSCTMTKVRHLEQHTLYYFKLQAATKAGQGPPTKVMRVWTIPARPESTHDRALGIIAGVGIGLGCIVICAIIILLRNRCCPLRDRYREPPPHVAANGHMPGHQPCYMSGTAVYLPSESHEMDSITPMLTSVPGKAHQGDVRGIQQNGCVHNGRKPMGWSQGDHTSSSHTTAFISNGNPVDSEDSPQMPLQGQSGQDEEDIDRFSGQYLHMPDPCTLDDIDQSVATEDKDSIHADSMFNSLQRQQHIDSKGSCNTGSHSTGDSPAANSNTMQPHGQSSSLGDTCTQGPGAGSRQPQPELSSGQLPPDQQLSAATPLDTSRHHSATSPLCASPTASGCSLQQHGSAEPVADQEQYSGGRSPNTSHGRSCTGQSCGSVLPQSRSHGSAQGLPTQSGHSHSHSVSTPQEHLNIQSNRTGDEGQLTNHIHSYKVVDGEAANHTHSYNV